MENKRQKSLQRILTQRHNDLYYLQNENFNSNLHVLCLDRWNLNLRFALTVSNDYFKHVHRNKNR
jgi:hypothetical protein